MAEEHDRMARAFDEWMRRYTQEPERFERERQSVGDFIRDEAKGRKPSYGASCAAYLRQLMAETDPQTGAG